MKYNNQEFLEIITPIIENCHFKELNKCIHHGITRYDHCLRVAYYTYKATKFMRLNYKEATIAAVLHDFFTDEVKDKNTYMKLIKHPEFAIMNAKKYFYLTDMQEDIIRTHMFPITFRPPKYLESWIADIADDIAAVYERGFTLKKELKAANTFLFLLVINYFNIR